MAKTTKKVDIPPDVRTVVTTAAKNLATHLWAQGPAWGTSFASLEELTAQITELLGTQLMHQALQRQANQSPPEHLQACPACSEPFDELPPDSRTVKRRRFTTASASLPRRSWWIASTGP